MKEKLITLVVGLALVVGLLGALPAAAAAPAPAAPLGAIGLGSPYTQDFNTLAASGTNNAWTDDSTLSGWYSTRSEYRAGTGSETNGALYSFGTGTDTDRALGSVASGSTNTIHYGVRFVNNTSNTIKSIAVSYTGEQWRNGGNTTQHSLTFDYQIGTMVTSLTTGTWTPVAALDFTGPIATNSAAALDGNASANHVALSHTFAVSIAPGEEIMLRWTDINDTGNDHGLAIDDFSLNVTLAVTLAEFSAAQVADHVLVSWETVSELDNRGFNLYRGTSPAGPDRQLNDALIPSQSQGSPTGFVYTWEDAADLVPGTTYFYWLEDVDVNGATTLHGPVSVDFVAPTAVRVTALHAQGGAPWRPGTVVVLAVLAALAAVAGQRRWVARR